MSGKDDLQGRLEALNRARLTGKLKPASDVPPDRAKSKAPVSLGKAVPGREVVSPAGSYYRVAAYFSQQGHAGKALVEQFPSLAGGAAADAQLDRDIAVLAQAGPTAGLYVDLETCGFAGNPVFLIGAAYWTGSEFVCEQLLARDYGEEPAILGRFAELLAERPVLVTFNGKSFDWPMLCERATVSRIDMPEPAGHADLLHVSRRVWPDMPNHRLTTLETTICRRHRTGDIEGAHIPEAYHDFVRTGDARLIGDIIRHNLWDLMTLAELTMLMLAGGQTQQ